MDRRFLRLRNPQLLADFFAQFLINICVARHAGALAGLLVLINIVAAAVAVQRAVVYFQVLNKLAALHGKLHEFQLFLRNDISGVAIRIIFPHIFQIESQRVVDVLFHFGGGAALRKYARQLL